MRQASRVSLETSMPTKAVAAVAAHGAAPLWLTNAGSCPTWAARETASEVEERRWSVRNLVLEVVPRPLHAVGPTAGPRSRKNRMLTCDPLRLTRRRKTARRIEAASDGVPSLP